MKKTLARFLSIMLVLALLAAGAAVAPASAEAAAIPEEFDLFIAYGGDKEAENDWGWGYTGTDVEGITAVTETIRVGESKTVSLTFDTPTVNSWYFAPCLVAEDVTGIGTLDFTVTCKIDGKDVPVDMNADAAVDFVKNEGRNRGDLSRDDGNRQRNAGEFAAGRDLG